MARAPRVSLRLASLGGLMSMLLHHTGVNEFRLDVQKGIRGAKLSHGRVLLPGRYPERFIVALNKENGVKLGFRFERPQGNFAEDPD